MLSATRQQIEMWTQEYHQSCVSCASSHPPYPPHTIPPTMYDKCPLWFFTIHCKLVLSVAFEGQYSFVSLVGIKSCPIEVFPRKAFINRTRTRQISARLAMRSVLAFGNMGELLWLECKSIASPVCRGFPLLWCSGGVNAKI